MPDRLSNLVVALIGLGGSLAVSYIAYRQWRTTRRDSARQDLVKARHQIYAELWKMVETVHTDLRLDPDKLPGLQDQIAEVNSYILKNDVYLADGDHELVDAYLQALGEMISWAQREGDAETQASMEATRPLSKEAGAVVRAFELRDKLKNRIRKALEKT
jgi:hypothetical protein